MKKFIWPVKVFFIKKITSTNYFAKLHSFSGNKNWTIVWSQNQTQGKGKGKNYWYSEKQKNLTFSITFNPILSFFSKHLYVINYIVSNAIHKFLTKTFNHNGFYIKWPNDILINHKKISGILIENNIFLHKINNVIIGIGLNVHQTKFRKEWNATSIKKEFNTNCNLYNILEEIIFAIQKEYFFFIKNGEKKIYQYYIKNLYMKDQISYFFLCKKNIFVKGIIRFISKKGDLIIEIHNKLYSFFQKEIQYININKIF
ncbi:biotin--[acetyl-CoA-carboxylase] ligase [Blattabacterium cuenoti]|uniref:biotin--[acetyl-CoA-carboxylase] ligase n=1 Tax=Blattabacterium cuenoti TaxID=1653831 RepID=UPI00163C2109|nr:biotin--[acetyl-CoA-carboxylase] ligase [Blattabacterium cuenoti]